MGLIDLQRQILNLCFDASPSEQTLASLGQRDVWLTYREMIRERLWRELLLALPRTHALVGDEAFAAAFEHHLAHEPPRTRYFHAIVSEFVHSALPLWAARPQLDPASCDMARYELARWEVRDIESVPPDQVVSEFAFERIAFMSRAQRVLKLSRAVHRPDDPAAQNAAEHFVCVHRAPGEDLPRVFSLTRTTFGLLERLLREDRCVSDVVKDLASASAARIDAAYLDSLCGTLAQFLEAGMILGSR